MQKGCFSMQKGISPSIMCADMLSLGRDLEALARAGSAYFHFDVMDGRFVPNFCLGPDLIRAARRASDVAFDYHFMVQEPERHFALFPIGAGDVVSVHAEACTHLQKTLSRIRELGAHPSLALNPATPLCALEEVLPDIDMLLIMCVNPGFAGQKLIPQSLDKIRRARRFLDDAGRKDVLIEVDGNVSLENAAKMRAAGADIYVAGTSAVFKKDSSIEKNMAALRAVIEG